MAIRQAGCNGFSWRPGAEAEQIATGETSPWHRALQGKGTLLGNRLRSCGGVKGTSPTMSGVGGSRCLAAAVHSIATERLLSSRWSPPRTCIHFHEATFLLDWAPNILASSQMTVGTCQYLKVFHIVMGKQEERKSPQNQPDGWLSVVLLGWTDPSLFSSWILDICSSIYQ